ncbi:TadE/TadG family type IV pilus assembly protein [Tenuibacillus multivorans]|uniref:TadE-like protein n=1 Tax=Tenuibacillus multivorans TaxID=237069 RepID=A0A1G9WI00_9BACI|nr:TadE family protein [Tenuibacillus multivorans]GEL76472.1 hypothetical protein TMU01_07070 [Tenuibacillus multivorans]SDM84110.1 TadE-like protein [Tenuibacillus multivorans]
MKLLVKKVKNENGSATIEFLGILPLAFVLLMIFIQFIVSVNGYLVAQSAANEYAKVYSVTEEHDEAKLAAEQIFDSTGSYLTNEDIDNSHDESGTHLKEFKVQINFSIDLIFLPEEILGATVPSITSTVEASSRVIE